MSEKQEVDNKVNNDESNQKLEKEENKVEEKETKEGNIKQTESKNLIKEENKKISENEGKKESQEQENKSQEENSGNIEKKENKEENKEGNNNSKEKEKNTKSENTKDKLSPKIYEESKEPFMQVASKELINCLNDENNRKCFDCEASPANWVCVNNGIFLCGKCAGEHRGYGAIISNLKFIMLDKLNEFQIEIMKRGGNKKLDNLLEEYKIDKNKTDKLILYSYRLLEYHRDYLYNKLAGKDDPKPPTKFDSTKIMSNFKDNPRPPLEKVKTKDEIFQENEKNQKKNNKKGNCKVQ